MRRANETMSAALAGADLAALPLNERVALGLRSRLAVFAPYGSGWAAAMALGAAPRALPETLRLLAIAADEIWWAAGDRSTDASWYSRRALLMALSAAAEAHMLTDASPGRAETDAFVARRLDELALASARARDGAAVAAAAGAGAAAVAAAACDLLSSIARGGGAGR
jgi:ubiquinone biosynthesis protein COQ9